MKGAILEKQKMYYTYMDMIFESLNNIQLKYNWLITDYECNHYPDEHIPYNKEYVWISGEELSKVVSKNQIQFIWGVFSAFEKTVELDNVLKYTFPCVDENPNFWINEVQIQHPLAEIEIVPFDSSLVLLISRNDDLVDLFIEKFPLAEELSKYNDGQKG